MFCHNCGKEVEEDYLYCPECGIKQDISQPSYRVILSDETVLTEKEAIEGYFYSGFTYETITHFLAKYNGITMSLKTLKRRLSLYNLKRNKKDINLSDVEGMIRHELDGPGCISGYRGMWHTLRVKYNVHVPRKEVEHLMRKLDPVGIEERKRHKLIRRKYMSPGPNHCWHTDGYDKIKPFGFAIHGCIDGYSRRIMWLVVDRTNNDPSVTAKFYINCVEEVGGCPTLLRSDCGTENGIMSSIQCFLRADEDDQFAGEKSHIYGSSTSNQRIECWWSSLMRSRLSWWINFFKDLKDQGSFLQGNILHEEALWFCFAEIIQKELDFVAIHWNTHYIRKSRHDTIAGKPDELYFLPEMTSTADQLHEVSHDKIEEAKLKCTSSETTNDYQEYFIHVLSLLGMRKPNHWKEASHLYSYLIENAE